MLSWPARSRRKRKGKQERERIRLQRSQRRRTLKSDSLAVVDERQSGFSMQWGEGVCLGWVFDPLAFTIAVFGADK